MRLVTFEAAPGCERLGLWIEDKIIDLRLASESCRETTGSIVPILPADMLTFLDQGEPAVEAVGNIAGWVKGSLGENAAVRDISGNIISYDPEQVRLCAPVPRPPKILCLALNYLEHAAEASRPTPENPYVFFKPNLWPVIGTNGNVIRPPKCQNLIFEGELAVVIGRRCRFVPQEKAYDVIAGYTAVNDMSARDLGKTNINQFDWFRVKAFDTSLPMGPCLTLKDEIADPHSLQLEVRVNDEVVQKASTEEMLFKIPEIIAFISEVITLDPGDIIATGTPGGSKGALKAGDQVEVDIEKIGVLRNIIVDSGV